MIVATASIFVLTAITLHILHRRIARDVTEDAVPAGRVIFEITPATVLSRKLTRGKVEHPIAQLYRILWYVHMLSGLAFAILLLIAPFR